MKGKQIYWSMLWTPQDHNLYTEVNLDRIHPREQWMNGVKKKVIMTPLPPGSNITKRNVNECLAF